jgi:heat shock protein HtpX
MSFTNQIKTVVLLGLLTALLLWVGNLIGGIQGLTVAIIFVVIMNFVSYWFSDKIVLMMYRAKPVKESEQPELYKIIKEISKSAQIPIPKIYVIDQQYANAFASGRSKNHAAVAVTKGIMNLLTKDELKGVIAHEISHIKNKDILIQTVAATIAGIISYVAMMVRYAAIFGGGNRDRNGNSGLELLILAIITPIIATLIQLAISRSREYFADESGAKLLKTGSGLASALEKLESSAKRQPLKASSLSNATAHLFILNPFRGEGFLTLFSTHPPVSIRIKKLNSLRF